LQRKVAPCAVPILGTFPGAGVFQQHAAGDVCPDMGMYAQIWVCMPRYGYCVFAQRTAAALSLTLRCNVSDLRVQLIFAVESLMVGNPAKGA
ncbi:MAG: hypothetical protein Q8L87_11040, partial [Anaerolineales bacterium]|nr:hypothetical protein [Anaerolineales bacterium]